MLNDKREDRVGLALYGAEVDVPRKILELRPRRPKHFSIVHRVGHGPGESRKQHDIGTRYLVCPACGNRSALWGRPTKRVCDGCGHNGEIGWWE